MHVLIIKNVFSEGPGTIADYLNANSIPYSICDLSIGDAAPELDSFSHLIIMGGPMAVYEMQQYPYLVNEALFIDRAIKANKYVLGVCLGAQMVAHVLGAKVYPGQKKEIGWYEVALTPDGMSDRLMSALALPGRNAAQVFQWHGDTFDLPRANMSYNALNRSRCVRTRFSAYCTTVPVVIINAQSLACASISSRPA
jgi:GMP synthase (glutamine-hydrolysing)